MEKEDITFLNQLVESLSKAETRIEIAYKGQNHLEFNRLKKFILDIQKKIIEVIG